MTNLLTKAGLGVALVATSLSFAAPAEAQRYYHRDRGGDAAGAAIVAGIAGLAIGAAIASSDDQRRYDRYPRYNYRYDRYPRYDYRYDRYPRYRDRYDRRAYRQRCWRERQWDEWRGRWVQVRRCR